MQLSSSFSKLCKKALQSLLLLAVSVPCISAQFYLNSADIGFHEPSASILKPSGENGLVWSYTHEKPGGDWFLPNFDHSEWNTGSGGFYRYIYPLAAWHIEDVDGTHVRIRNHWFPNLILHTGYKNSAPFNDPNSDYFRRPAASTFTDLQSKALSSALWRMETLPDQRVRLRSRWGESEYLNVENDLQVGPADMSWQSINWTLEPTRFPIKPGEKRPVYLKSFWGHYLTAKMLGSVSQATKGGFQRQTAAYLNSNLDFSMGAHFRLNFLEDAQTVPIEYGVQDLWLRSTFTLQPRQEDHLMFWARWSRTMKIYINGVEASDLRLGQAGYRHIGLNPTARDTLIADGVTANHIAVRVSMQQSDLSANSPVQALAAKRENFYFDLGLSLKKTLAKLPIRGAELNQELYQRITVPFREYLQEQGISAGVLAVSYDDKIILNRAFGYADKEFKQPLARDAVFRLASVDKAVTKKVIEKLIDDGVDVPDPANLAGPKVALTLSTPVFPLLKRYGLAAIAGSPPDPRADLITVQNLLDHLGWIKELPNFKQHDIEGGMRNQFYSDLGVQPGNSTIHDNVRWTYSQPLTNSPGTFVPGAYNSNGYSILRYLAHQVAVNELRTTFLGFMQSMFRANGDDSVYIAKDSVAGRTAHGEPWYNDPMQSYERWLGLDNYFAVSASARAMALFNDKAVEPSNFTGASLGSWSWLGYQYNHSANERIHFSFMVNTGGHFTPIVDELYNTLWALPEKALQQSFASVDLPTVIEAEAYSGAGRDSSSGNSGKPTECKYLGLDVDVENSAQGTCNVGWTSSGEYLTYAVDTAGGKYDLQLNAASGKADHRIRVSVNDRVVGTVYSQGRGWQQWSNLALTNISIPSNSTLKVEFVDGAVNLDFIKVTEAAYYNALSSRGPMSLTAEAAYNADSPAYCAHTQWLESTHSGFTGRGYLNAPDTMDTSLEWEIDAATTGRHTLTWRHANGGRRARYSEVIVNGVFQGHLNFNKTQAWHDWAEESLGVDLLQGQNTIQLIPQTSAGLANIDSLTVRGGATTAGSCGP